MDGRLGGLMDVWVKTLRVSPFHYLQNEQCSYRTNVHDDRGRKTKSSTPVLLDLASSHALVWVTISQHRRFLQVKGPQDPVASMHDRILYGQKSRPQELTANSPWNSCRSHELFLLPTSNYNNNNNDNLYGAVTFGQIGLLFRGRAF